MMLELHPKDEIYLRLNADDVRISRFVRFIDDSRIAVEQTQPVIDNTFLMSLIFFTYHPKKQDQQRMGFQARIESITPDRQIVVRQLTQPFICDLRLWPRVHFDVLPDAHAFCNDQEIRVFDVSGGGTRLVLREDDPAAPSVGSLVQIRFRFDKGETTADGRILREWTDRQGLRYIEVQFLGEPEIRSFIYR